MTITAKVFTTGNSQAVRLPKAFRVNTREMGITRNEQTGEITLKPKPNADALQAFLNELRSLPASDEFVPPRDGPDARDPQHAPLRSSARLEAGRLDVRAADPAETEAQAILSTGRQRRARGASSPMT